MDAYRTHTRWTSQVSPTRKPSPKTILNLRYIQSYRSIKKYSPKISQFHVRQLYHAVHILNSRKRQNSQNCFHYLSFFAARLSIDSSILSKQLQTEAVRNNAAQYTESIMSWGRRVAQMHTRNKIVEVFIDVVYRQFLLFANLFFHFESA